MLALIGFLGLSALVPISRAALATTAMPALQALWLPGAVLCPLTGVAAWLVWRRIDVAMDRKRAALRRWGWQLLLGGLWPAALYGAGSLALALVLLGLLLLTALVTWLAFRRLQTTAALLLLPYCAWVLCAALITADRFWPGAI